MTPSHPHQPFPPPAFPPPSTRPQRQGTPPKRGSREASQQEHSIGYKEGAVSAKAISAANSRVFRGGKTDIRKMEG
jgi:hypothetical protein